MSGQYRVRVDNTGYERTSGVLCPNLVPVTMRCDSMERIRGDFLVIFLLAIVPWVAGRYALSQRHIEAEPVCRVVFPLQRPQLWQWLSAVHLL